MPEITWKDPPADTGVAQRQSNRVLEEAMRAEPGRWLLFREGVPGGGQGSHIRAKGFEVQRVRREDGLYDIYARWPRDAGE